MALCLLMLSACLFGGGGKDEDDTGSDGSSGDGGTITPDPPGPGVLLYVGDGGGGPGTDLYPTEVEALFADAGIAVLLSETLPADWVESYGVLVLLNPTSALSAEVTSGAAALLDRGGRLVIGFEREGWGNTAAHNELLVAVGSTMRTVSAQSSGGEAHLSVQDVGGLTAGVSSLLTFYSASVDLGEGDAVSVGEADGTTVVGYEAVGRGDVVIVADSSFFGYALDEADNARFIENFASLR